MEKYFRANRKDELTIQSLEKYLQVFSPLLTSLCVGQYMRQKVHVKTNKRNKKSTQTNLFHCDIVDLVVFESSNKLGQDWHN